MMDLVSRLIGIHKLQLLGFYTFIQQYLKPHQREVTKLLLFAAQAAHTEASPDVSRAVMHNPCVVRGVVPVSYTHLTLPTILLV